MSSLISEPVGVQAPATVKTKKQQIKQDAIDLAEIIYDIFKDGLSNATIGEISIKENTNVE